MNKPATIYDSLVNLKQWVF